ncbi:DUF6227 family protein [Streptomyces hoynatensis]|uniref:Uncharacterized protein n=1 Tax=Streptomyces hoynatensis TaxID=1141874 RepID=A0A3A9YSL9_9ACTN|nr:DUF6227 family protein [Streptomyces hoynatensis]RKN38809.1 hypothetical protein D7294_23570 [Streptomyces hoynatensis]
MTDQPEALPGSEIPSAEELELLLALKGTAGQGALPGESLPRQRSYPGQDSPDHARRLLRRAVNPDRPGEDVLRLLAAARGYDIERLPEPPGRGCVRGWCSVYEHAFLLADGSEVCLYELEHDQTPDHRLVCEVYREEWAAELAARRAGAASREPGVRGPGTREAPGR